MWPTTSMLSTNPPSMSILLWLLTFASLITARNLGFHAGTGSDVVIDRVAPDHRLPEITPSPNLPQFARSLDEPIGIYRRQTNDKEDDKKEDDKKEDDKKDENNNDNKENDDKNDNGKGGDEHDDNDNKPTSTRPPSSRKTTESSASTTSNASDSSITGSATATKTTETGTESIIVASPTASYGPLPSPFDTNRIDNFTAPSCPKFFDNFLGNETFNACLPISVLLQNSNSFFSAMKSVVLTTRTLDASCAAPAEQCTSLMKSLADSIVKDEMCGQDNRRGNPLVVAALNGFRAYRALRDATCLKSPETDNYCFADAVGSSNPANSIVYYLGLGIPLPGSSRPNCNKCLQGTMGIYSKAAADKNQPVSAGYIAAAEQINIGCGPAFVPTAVFASAGIEILPSVAFVLTTFIGSALLLNGAFTFN
ncbi:hypothetical protein FQN57_001986 [Myotisia sp. PD_48]|nr:hypothetical protein FQN57_001986 [Myotisia sp. PD_48]